MCANRSVPTKTGLVGWGRKGLLPYSLSTASLSPPRSAPSFAQPSYLGAHTFRLWRFRGEVAFLRFERIYAVATCCLIEVRTRLLAVSIAITTCLPRSKHENSKRCQPTVYLDETAHRNFRHIPCEVESTKMHANLSIREMLRVWTTASCRTLLDNNGSRKQEEARPRTIPVCSKRRTAVRGRSCMHVKLRAALEAVNAQSRHITWFSYFVL